MIQRRQTIWLLLSTVAALLTFLYPFATGEEIVEGTAMRRRAEVIAGGQFFTLVLSIATVALSVVTLFSFKNRPLQMKLCWLGIFLAAGLLALYVLQYRQLLEPTPALWSVLPVATLAGYFLAWRDIRKDERLVKSLDKLR